VATPLKGIDMRYEVKVFTVDNTYIETLDRKTFKSKNDLFQYLKELGYTKENGFKPSITQLSEKRR